MTPATTSRAAWTLAITGIALFMTAVDSLVVGVALHSIRLDLGGSIEGLEWTVNAYTLAFAVLLLTGAALGDRFGRKRMFIAGTAIFTAASALAALSPSVDALIAARALQGLGAAIVTPLTLTLVSEAFPPERRATALGIWGGLTGLGVALGPFVGGAVVEGIAWQWIFWANVPIGLVLVPLAGARSHRVAWPRPRARPAWSRARIRRHVRADLRTHPRRVARLDKRRRDRVARRRRRPARRTRALGTHHAGADAADGLLPRRSRACLRLASALDR